MSPLLIGTDGNQTPSALSFRVWKSFPADKMPEIRACVLPHNSKSVNDVKRTEICLKMWIIGGNCANQRFVLNPQKHLWAKNILLTRNEFVNAHI